MDLTYAVLPGRAHANLQGGTDRDEPANPFGGVSGDPHRRHAPERYPADISPLDRRRVEHAERVGADVLQRVLPLGVRRLSVPARIHPDDPEGLREGRHLRPPDVVGRAERIEQQQWRRIRGAIRPPGYPSAGLVDIVMVFGTLTSRRSRRVATVRSPREPAPSRPEQQTWKRRAPARRMPQPDRGTTPGSRIWRIASRSSHLPTSGSAASTSAKSPSVSNARRAAASTSACACGRPTCGASRIMTASAMTARVWPPGSAASRRMDLERCK